MANETEKLITRKMSILYIHTSYSDGLQLHTINLSSPRTLGDFLVSREGVGGVVNLRTTTSQKCAVVPMRARIRLTDSRITQLKAQGPSRTCNESKEEDEKTGAYPTVWLGPRGVRYPG